MGLGPFDWTGGPILELYITLFVLAVAAGLWIPGWLRPEGRDAAIRDADSLAWLAGGPQRVADATAARMLATGALTMLGKTFVSQHGVPSRWAELRVSFGQAAMPVERRLISAGLVIDTATAWHLRIWQTLPLLMLLPFGAIKWEIGRMRERPVGYLTALLLVTTIVAVIRFARIDRRTRAGKRLLARARRDADRLRRAPTAGEVDLAVALFGTAVLVASPWVAFHQLRTSSDGGSSGGDSSSGCGGGGGGGGGGGCGGCGS